MTKRYIRTVQDVLDYAIEQEEKANKLYKHMARDATKEELRTALENFAIDEARHKIRLEGVRDGKIELAPDQIGSLNLADTIEAVPLRANMNYKELLAFAIKKEAEAEYLYRKLAEMSNRESLKELFTLLAQEEARHKFNLEFEYDLATF